MAFSKGTERVMATLPQDDSHRWQWVGEGLSLPGGRPCGSDLICYKYWHVWDIHAGQPNWNQLEVCCPLNALEICDPPWTWNQQNAWRTWKLKDVQSLFLELKKKKCPFSCDLPVFVWFLIKDQSSPILNTHTQTHTNTNHNSSAGNRAVRRFALKNSETCW